MNKGAQIATLNELVHIYMESVELWKSEITSLIRLLTDLSREVVREHSPAESRKLSVRQNTGMYELTD